MPKNDNNLKLLKEDILSKPPIGLEELAQAVQILQEYKSGKANLESKIIENEQWWKLRHWDYIDATREDIEPASAWLFNCIANKHADFMDNYPMPNILPREESDKQEAKSLSSIIPVILQQNNFESVYSDVSWYKLKHGCGVYQIVWNNSKLNGLGDIDIQKADLLNLFWAPGITDIQKSPHFFNVELVDNKILEENHPELKGKLQGASFNTATYLYDDTVRTDDKSVVVDWYYCKDGNLQYCKFVNDVVLFSTENEVQKAVESMEEDETRSSFEKGWYDHGLYPFVFDTLFPVEGSPCGFGYIDICRNPQEYIDRMSRGILKNALVNSIPRYFTLAENDFNEDDFFDTTKPFIRCEGSLSENSMKPANTTTLNGVYLSVMENKIEELKETSGNRDVSNGGTTAGATAASAIAAMQEAGSKLSRDMIKASYRAYNKIVNFCIELVRQFYDEKRSFRITGDMGEMKFQQYSNENIKPQPYGNDFNMDMGIRLPVFDIEVSAQRNSPYAKVSQNEMALNFYKLGFFNPQLADQALACLDMMDFDRKSSVEQKISQNGTMYQQIQAMSQQMLQMAQILDAQNGTNISGEISEQLGMPAPVSSGEGGQMQMQETDSLGTPDVESNVTAKARQRVADSTAPA